MRISFLLFALVLMIAACAGRQTSGPELGPRTVIFPNGTYTHRVTIHMPQDRNYGFRSIVAVSDDFIRVVGLSFLNTTAFRLVEDRKSGKLDSEIYLEPMKKYDARLRQFYSNLRMLMLLPLSTGGDSALTITRRDSDGYPLEARTHGLEKDVSVLFQSYDRRKIPTRMQIRAKDFSVDIEVSDYDLG